MTPPIVRCDRLGMRFVRGSRRAMVAASLRRAWLGDAVADGDPRCFWAVRDVSLELPPGTRLGVCGQNGSGKTTLAHHLNGLLAPTSGRVRLDGVDLRASTVGRIARTVGFVFQDPDHQLFCDSVEEEVAFGLRHLGLGESEVADRTRSTLAACGLESRRADDPFLLGKGERQRLAVAAVLAIDPAVLILDEPTTGLDHREQCRMIELLRDLHRSGRTIVVITHAPWLVAEHAERAILLERGRILVDGPVAELLGRRDLLRRARFALPEATELGLRFGFAARSPQHLIAAVKRASGGAP